jgi:hypothetical protein
MDRSSRVIKGGNVAHNEWDWPIAANFQKHNERVALLRPIPYEVTVPADDDPLLASRQGKALSVNISSGGMLILMDEAPAVEQVLKVLVPTPTAVAETPTLAEVRWTRKVPFGKSNGNGPYFVGLKFIF